MARGDKGFGAQWNSSKRRGSREREQGRGAYADDLYLHRENRRLSGPPATHRGQSKSCLEKTAALLLFLGVLGFVLAQASGKVA